MQTTPGNSSTKYWRPMHEFSICQGLLGEVEIVDRARPASSVTDIYVNIGPLSGVEPSLQRITAQAVQQEAGNV